MPKIRVQPRAFVINIPVHFMNTTSQFIHVTIRSAKRVGLLCLAVVVLLAPGARADEPAPPKLADEMGEINRNFRLVKHQWEDPAQKADTLKLVDVMLKHAQVAQTLTPPRLDKLAPDPDSRAKYLAAYHKHIGELITEIGVLKSLISAGKAEDIQDEIQKIGELKETSPDELGVKSGKDKNRANVQPLPPPPAPAPAPAPAN